MRTRKGTVVRSSRGEKTSTSRALNNRQHSQHTSDSLRNSKRKINACAEVNVQTSKREDSDSTESPRNFKKGFLWMVELKK